MERGELMRLIGEASLRLDGGVLTIRSSKDVWSRWSGKNEHLSNRSSIAVSMLSQRDDETTLEICLTFEFSEQNTLVETGSYIGMINESDIGFETVDPDRILSKLDKLESAETGN